MSAANRVKFEAIAGLYGISLDALCFWQSYRYSLKHEQPGVPGVTAEVLGMKLLPSAEKRLANYVKEGKDSPQLRMGL